MNLKNSGILLGHVPTHSSREKVHFARADRTRHVYICGATGTGKSTLLYNMLRQDIDNNEGVILIDPHGGCTDAIIRELNQAKNTVLVQAYSFTSAPIAKALLNAHKRGVKVEVILSTAVNVTTARGDYSRQRRGNAFLRLGAFGKPYTL